MNTYLRIKVDYLGGMCKNPFSTIQNKLLKIIFLMQEH